MALAFVAAPANAQLHIDITEGNLNPMPIAVVDFFGQNSAAQQVGRDVAGVIRADLERSALFHTIPDSAFIERLSGMEVTPRFPDGFTVLSGYGQYRDAAGKIVQEGARMLIVWHAPGDRNADVEAIREAYKARFVQESVLRSDGANCVSF